LQISEDEADPAFIDYGAAGKTRQKTPAMTL